VLHAFFRNPAKVLVPWVIGDMESLSPQGNRRRISPSSLSVWGGLWESKPSAKPLIDTYRARWVGPMGTMLDQRFLEVVLELLHGLNEAEHLPSLLKYLAVEHITKFLLSGSPDVVYGLVAMAEKWSSELMVE
jgi:hypothetical protein